MSVVKLTVMKDCISAQSFYRQRDVFRLQVDHDAVAAQLFSHRTGGAAAAERVQNQTRHRRSRRAVAGGLPPDRGLLDHPGQDPALDVGRILHAGSRVILRRLSIIFAGDITAARELVFQIRSALLDYAAVG